LLVFIFISFFFGSNLFGDIEGKVFDKNTRLPISNVEITIAKTDLGTTSNEDGYFKIEHRIKSNILVFNHIAYETKFTNLDNIDTFLIVDLKESLLQMDDVVVTSMRSGYLLRNVPVSTEVISKKEIESSGAITIDQLLSQRSGVSSTVNVDGGSVFNLLGLDSRYILVLKDGQPLTGRFKNRVDLSQININRVQKIEIIKGPGSALYGTDAMGGVINIITNNDYSNKQYSIKYRATSFGANLDQIKSDPVNNTFISNIILPFEDVTINTDFTYQSFSKGQQFEYIKADQINKINTNTDINWNKKSRQSFFINFQTFNQNDQGATRSAFGDVLFENSTKIERSIISLKHNWKYSKKAKVEQSLRLSNYSRDYTVIEISNDLSQKDVTKEKDIEYEIMYTKSYPVFNLVYGMEFSKPEYTSDRIKGGNQSFHQNGAFVQADIDLRHNIDLVTGLRVDRFQDTIVVSPRIAVSYKITNSWKLRCAYGFGFRSPSFMESLIDWEHVQFGYRVIGNRNLKPEVSRGITIGAEYTNNNNFQISYLLYQNRFKNLIEDYSIEPGLLGYRNINIAKFSGIEITTKWAITSKSSISTSYNYLRNVDGEDDIIPNTIPHSFGSRFSTFLLKNKVMISLNSKINGKFFPQEFDPNSGDYILSKNAVKAAITSNLFIQYKINRVNKILFGLNNLSNHTNKSYGPFIGRVFFIEFQKIINNNK